MERYLTELQEKSGSLFMRDVTRIDCAIWDPARGMIGESWYMDVELTGALDENGFVYDFSHLKQLLRQVSKTSLDHSLLIPIGNSNVQYAESNGNQVWRLKTTPKAPEPSFIWEYRCPKGAVFGINSVALKKSAAEVEFAKLMKHRLPPSIQAIKVKLRKEDAEPTAAFFRYTHGISGHGGLCQRLFHGHRSRVEIFVGDDRRPDLEHYVARNLLGSEVHIATPSQITSGPYEVGRRLNTHEPLTLSYDSTLGHYEASIPSNRVFVVEQETSIECITHQIAMHLRQTMPDRDPIAVWCYEGIDKGAVVRLN